jgi:hypothetical protein
VSKKISIEKENFVRQNIFTKKYQIRFRIVSEDRNNLSYWSPIFSVDPGFTFVPDGSISVSPSSGLSSVVWNPVKVTKDEKFLFDLRDYDLWIRWGTAESNGEWTYNQTTSSNSVDLIKPTSPSGINTLSVEIYRPMSPSIYRKATYDIYQSNSAGKINLTNDIITISSINVLETGMPVRYTSSDPVGGLSSGTVYFVRMISGSDMTLHPTQADAANNTNKINITSHKNSVGFFSWEDCTVCDFLVYSIYNVKPV